MKKHLNILNTVAEYQEYSASTAYSKPNVTYVRENKVLYYDYGDNKPQVDMSDFKVESQEISVGGVNCGKTAITKINYIPSDLPAMDSYFSEFYNLKEVTCELPSALTSLHRTFYWCKSLVKLPQIPSGVTEMEYTFYFCQSLNELTFLMITPPPYYVTLGSCSSLESIYVPDESVDAYKTATGWSEFADKIKPLSSKPSE